MEVKILSTPLDEAFVVDAIIPSETVSIEVADPANPSKGIISIVNLLVIGLHARMIGATSSSTADPLVGLIGTFGTTNSPAGKSCMLEAVKAESYTSKAM